jgi:hypothetical protein
MPTNMTRAFGARTASAALLALTATTLAAQTPASPLTDGLRFRTIGPAAMSGRIVDLAVVEATPQVFYAASSTGGLYKTTNNGTTFTPLFGDQGTHSIGAIAVHQRDTNVVWVGTGERANRQSSSWGDGVYLSRDGGRSFRNVGLRLGHIGRIVLHLPMRTWPRGDGHAVVPTRSGPLRDARRGRHDPRAVRR